jgi:hypothetical protein
MKPEINMTDVAEDIVLSFFQCWGQDRDKRLKSLNDAIASIGIKGEFISKDDEIVFTANTNEEIIRGKRFYEDLSKCWPKGRFEAERDAVEEVLRKHSKEKANA